MKKILRDYKVGEQTSQWKGGLTKNPNYYAIKSKEWREKNRERYLYLCREWYREYRHKKGISKQYRIKNIDNPIWKVNKTEYNRINKKRLRAIKKYNGNLTMQTIYKVYEDNRREFGILTCIYCFKPLIDGGDTLDHIIPINKGGSNEYDNLTISCQNCNNMKHHFTIDEWSRRERTLCRT